MRRFAIATILIFSLAAGCQNTTVLTDADKQVQIDIMYRRYARQFSNVKSITAQELQQLQKQGENVVLIDVRSPAEIAVSSIPGAITTAEFESNLAQYRDAIVVAYCTIGYRSGLYAQKLEQQGIEISNLAGSLLAWSHVGGKLTKGQKSTRRVHVFGRQWQLTPESYEAVW